MLLIECINLTAVIGFMLYFTKDSDRTLLRGARVLLQQQVQRLVARGVGPQRRRQRARARLAPL